MVIRICDICKKEHRSDSTDRYNSFVSKIDNFTRMNLGEDIKDVCGDCSGTIKKIYDEVSSKYTTVISKQVKSRIMLELLKR